MLLVAVVAAAVLLPDQRLVSAQVDSQRRVGHPPANEMVYSVLAQHPEIRGEIITDYWYLSVLPGFRWAPFRAERSDGIHVSTPFYSAVTPAMLNSKGLSYVLLSNYIPEPARAWVDARIADGSYTVLGTYRTEQAFPPYFEGRPIELRFIRIDRRAPAVPAGDS